MKNIKIPKLNINSITNISNNNNYFTPRNEKSSNNISNSENSLFTTFNKLSPNVITHFSFNFSPTKDSISNTNYYNNNSKYNIKNNDLFSSYKIIIINDFVLNERLKTSSTRYTEQTFYKDKLDKFRKSLEKKKKIIKLKKINSYSLSKMTKDQVNEVNFIPSPFLINTSKISKLNLIQNNLKNIKKRKKVNNFKIENKKINSKDENLPIFLRDKYNIKGTNIISPFCIKARDESLYKRIFYNYFKKPIIVKKKGIDNKLNIFYAENEEKFKKKMKKINEKIRKEGKKEKNAFFPNSVEYKLAKIKHKIKFMKKIVDYAYPEMVLTRVREANKILENSRNRTKNLIPFRSADNKILQYNKILTKNLAKSFVISKL